MRVLPTYPKKVVEHLNRLQTASEERHKRQIAESRARQKRSASDDGQARDQRRKKEKARDVGRATGVGAASSRDQPARLPNYPQPRLRLPGLPRPATLWQLRLWLRHGLAHRTSDV